MEKDVKDFMDKKMSTNLTYSEKIITLIRLGIETFDIMDYLRELKKQTRKG